MKNLVSALAVFFLAANASSAAGADFPDSATTPTAAELHQRLSGNNFSVKYANGASSRLQFKDNGYYFVDVSNGYRDNGEWRTEDGKVCTSSQKQGANCFAARISADALHLQRANGEIIQYEPR